VKHRYKNPLFLVGTGVALLTSTRRLSADYEHGRPRDCTGRALMLLLLLLLLLVMHVAAKAERVRKDACG
jgi:hypothetical protein